MAAVSSAVDSTMCGQLPRCIHIDTLATAWCCAASASVVVLVLVFGCCGCDCFGAAPVAGADAGVGAVDAAGGGAG